MGCGCRGSNSGVTTGGSVMTSCGINPYTLPMIDFVGGSEQELRFHVYWHTGKEPFDMSYCTANFSLVSYQNRKGAPIIEKAMTVEDVGDSLNGDTVHNCLRVTLTPAETVALSGKYVYQVSIKDRSNPSKAEIPNQGLIYITNNINKSYITG